MEGHGEGDKKDPVEIDDAADGTDAVKNDTNSTQEAETGNDREGLLGKAHHYKRLLDALMAERGIAITAAARVLAKTESISHQGIINLVYPLEIIDSNPLVRVMLQRGILNFSAIFQLRKGAAEYGMSPEEILQRAIELREDDRDCFPGGKLRDLQRISVKITTTQVKESIEDLLKNWDPRRLPKPQEKPPTEVKNSPDIEAALDIIRTGIAKLFGAVQVLEGDPEKTTILIKERITDAIQEIKSKTEKVLGVILEANPKFAESNNESGTEFYKGLMEFLKEIRERMARQGVLQSKILEEMSGELGAAAITLWQNIWVAEFAEEQVVARELVKLGKLSKAPLYALRSACRTHGTTPERILALVIRNRDIQTKGSSKAKYGMADVIHAGVKAYSEREITEAGEAYATSQEFILEENASAFDPERPVTMLKYGLFKLEEAIRKDPYDCTVVDILNQAKGLLTEASKITHDNVVPIEYEGEKPTFAQHSKQNGQRLRGESERIQSALGKLIRAADEENGMVFFAKEDLVERERERLIGELERIGITLQEYTFSRKRIGSKGRPYTNQTGYRLEWKTGKIEPKKKARKTRAPRPTPPIQPPAASPAPSSPVPAPATVPAQAPISAPSSPTPAPIPAPPPPAPSSPTPAPIPAPPTPAPSSPTPAPIPAPPPPAPPPPAPPSPAPAPIPAPSTPAPSSPAPAPIPIPPRPAPAPAPPDPQAELRRLRGKERGEIYEDKFVYRLRHNSSARLSGQRLRIITWHHRAHRDIVYVGPNQVVVIRESDMQQREPEGFTVYKNDLERILTEEERAALARSTTPTPPPKPAPAPTPPAAQRPAPEPTFQPPQRPPSAPTYEQYRPPQPLRPPYPSHGPRFTPSTKQQKPAPQERRMEQAALCTTTREFITDNEQRIPKGMTVKVIPKGTDEYQAWLDANGDQGVGKKSRLVWTEIGGQRVTFAIPVRLLKEF